MLAKRLRNHWGVGGWICRNRMVRGRGKYWAVRYGQQHPARTSWRLWRWWRRRCSLATHTSIGWGSRGGGRRPGDQYFAHRIPGRDGARRVAHDCEHRPLGAVAESAMRLWPSNH